MLQPLESFADTVVAVDGHRSLLLQAHAASRRTTLLQSDLTRTKLQGNQFDLIVAFDVLEHVPADPFLREALRLARDNARLLISVPAFPSLWSQMDVCAGHRCRYRFRPLAEELSRNGWTPQGHTHFQLLLFPLVWASRRITRFSPTGIERRPPRWLDRLLGAINLLEIRMLHRLSLPFGSTLIAWATKNQ
jgi:SAM-dependent methyltransferase